MELYAPSTDSKTKRMFDPKMPPLAEKGTVNRCRPCLPLIENSESISARLAPLLLPSAKRFRDLSCSNLLDWCVELTTGDSVQSYVLDGAI
jgi:hypothetical protein